MNHHIENKFGLKRVACVIGILIAAAAVTSCGDDRGGSHHHAADSHSGHSDRTIPQEGLALNHGHKWKMDDHTRSSFAEMATFFLHSDRAFLEEEDLKKAGAQLQTQTQDLIRGCTMSGEAHNQLHVYLSGYIPAVDALAQSGRDEDAQKVRHYLEMYRDYFE